MKAKELSNDVSESPKRIIPEPGESSSRGVDGTCFGWPVIWTPDSATVLMPYGNLEPTYMQVQDWEPTVLAPKETMNWVKEAPGVHLTTSMPRANFSIILPLHWLTDR